MTRDLTCPRCRTPSVLAVLRRPHTWTNASRNQVRGVGEVLLCARCDAGDPLVTYLVVHESVQPEDAAHLARLLLHWIDGTRPRKPDETALKAEAEAWYRGEL
ncbi:DUF6300 family protein [Nonomuraea sp. SYSU D8015]|uniref:DUF6300 family protein n=1 Tax=Nonomuraea sp. SYSU D8015 TaxID=2593644 RepID=UPI001660BF47|nr:DUF6300 family protein [Nonomuraea sp. SYSU D8015]